MRKMVEMINKEIEKDVRKGFGYVPFEDYEDLSEEIEEFEENFKKRKEIVRQVLDGWEKSRNSDTLFYWECLRLEFPEIELTSSKDRVIFKIPKKIIKFLPSPESYLRVRRKFNENGEFLPTNPLVLEKRKRREKIIRDFFASENYMEKVKVVK